MSHYYKHVRCRYCERKLHWDWFLVYTDIPMCMICEAKLNIEARKKFDIANNIRIVLVEK